MARNGYALALLMALVVAGCSNDKKEAQEAEAKLAALRVRTDSLRKARRLADSLAQVRYTVCADSVRTEMSKPPVVTKAKKKKKQSKVVPPSEELIVAQVQSVCAQNAGIPQATVAAAGPAPEKGVSKDSVKSPARAEAPAPTPEAALNGPSAQHVAAQPVATRRPDSASAPDPAYADSVRRSREVEMYRETFSYGGSTRDPFNSLLNMAKSGPELADLQLVGIYQNLRIPSRSVAVFREKEGGKRHKLRAGDQVGRSRLVQIRERDVVFVIEDFGFERQETLSLRKQEDVTP